MKYHWQSSFTAYGLHHPPIGSCPESEEVKSLAHPIFVVGIFFPLFPRWPLVWTDLILYSLSARLSYQNSPDLKNYVFPRTLKQDGLDKGSVAEIFHFRQGMEGKKGVKTEALVWCYITVVQERRKTGKTLSHRQSSFNLSQYTSYILYYIPLSSSILCLFTLPYHETPLTSNSTHDKTVLASLRGAEIRKGHEGHSFVLQWKGTGNVDNETERDH